MDTHPKRFSDLQPDTQTVHSGGTAEVFHFFTLSRMAQKYYIYTYLARISMFISVQKQHLHNVNHCHETPVHQHKNAYKKWDTLG